MCHSLLSISTNNFSLSPQKYVGIRNTLPLDVPSHIISICSAYPIAEFDIKLSSSFVVRLISSYSIWVSINAAYVENHARPMNDAAVFAAKQLNYYHPCTALKHLLNKKIDVIVASYNTTHLLFSMSVWRS